MLKYIGTILLSLWVFLFNAQTHEIDSLKKRLSKEPYHDTIRAIDLNELGWQYLDISVDSSKHYASLAENLSEELNYTEGIISSKSTMGIVYRLNNEYEKAIHLLEEIIHIRKQQNNFERLTGAYANLGNVYYEMNDFAKALSFYNKGLEVAKTHHQKDKILVLLSNIGATYKAGGLNDLAIKSFNEGLELNKEIKDRQQQGLLYLNIATIYDQRGLFPEAYKFYKYAYKIFKEENNIRQMSVALFNLSTSSRNVKDYFSARYYISEMEKMAKELNDPDYYYYIAETKANYFSCQNQYQLALDEANKGLQFVDSINNRHDYGVMLLIKADILNELKEYDKAIKLCQIGINIMKDENDLIEISKSYNSLSEIYKKKKDYEKALYYYDKATVLSDSIHSQEYDNKIAVLNSLNELDKTEKELELSNKEKEKVEAENKRKTTLLVAGLLIVILIIILLVFSVRAYRIKQKDNIILNSQKQEIELKNSILEDSNKKIEHQKELIEEKQKEIVDSINYAKRIQYALLAHDELLKNNLKNHFVYFQPKDIVSGDFYWATHKIIKETVDNTSLHDLFYIAVCDSTGHGVPGAFMSLLNISYMNEAINEKHITKPHEVLNYVREKLIQHISHDGSQDGMDAILICFNKTTKQISYAAANNAPLLIQNSEIIALPTDKMPVGKGIKNESFNLYPIQANPGDTLFLYTDGFADQFGGPQGKKFKYKALNELLKNNFSKPFHEQHQILSMTFNQWKNDLEQIDDVCIVGIQI